jgi:hypothetical protein
MVGPKTLGILWSKPKVNAIEKMKARRIDQPIGIRTILRAEEDRGCEDSLEALNHSPIMTTIGCKTEEIKHPKGSFKVDGAAFLLHGESGYPNGDQPILAEGQAILGVRRDLQKELSVLSRMGQLTGWWAAERQAAEDKRSSMESESLLPHVALLAGKVDRFELPEPPFRRTDGGKTRASYGRDGRHKSVSVRVSVDPVNRGI